MGTWVQDYLCQHEVKASPDQCDYDDCNRGDQARNDPQRNANDETEDCAEEERETLAHLDQLQIEKLHSDHIPVGAVIGLITMDKIR